MAGHQVLGIGEIRAGQQVQGWVSLGNRTTEESSLHPGDTLVRTRVAVGVPTNPVLSQRKKMRPRKVKWISFLFLIFPISSLFFLFVGLKNKVASSTMQGDGLPGDSFWAVCPHPILSVGCYMCFSISLCLSFKISLRNETLKVLIYFSVYILMVEK